MRSNQPPRESEGSPRRSPWCSLRRSLQLLILLGAATACSTNTPVRAPHINNEPMPESPPAAVYKIETGDLLSIRFYGNSELDEEQPVRPDGRISLPFVGQVEAAGLTPGELEKALVSLYERELVSPQITVIVREFQESRYFVGGEVGAQGAYSMSGRLTLLQAIQEAGGFLPSARRQQVILIRMNPDGTRFGRAINVRAAQTGKDPNSDVFLQPADVVFVPRSRIANIGLFIESYIRDILPIRPDSLVVSGN